MRESGRYRTPGKMAKSESCNAECEPAAARVGAPRETRRVSRGGTDLGEDADGVHRVGEAGDDRVRLLLALEADGAMRLADLNHDLEDSAAEEGAGVEGPKGGREVLKQRNAESGVSGAKVAHSSVLARTRHAPAVPRELLERVGLVLALVAVHDEHRLNPVESEGRDEARDRRRHLRQRRAQQKVGNPALRHLHQQVVQVERHAARVDQDGRTATCQLVRAAACHFEELRGRHRDRRGLDDARAAVYSHDEMGEAE